MTQSPEPGTEGAPGADTPALHEEAAQARTLLKKLKREVATVERRLRGSLPAIDLLEANEQLVLAILKTQAKAEITAQALQAVSRAVQLDRLTGLPNRMLLLDRFAQAIAHARREHTRVALLFVDLNRFKQINDTLGHAAGDDVLKLAARALTASVRSTDTVSRHGGDEFLILLADVTDLSAVSAIAEKVIESLAVPSRIGDHILRLTASIGISIFPDHGEDAYTLTDRADAAMYQAKRTGLGGYSFYGSGAADAHAPSPAVLNSLLHPLTHFRLAQAEKEHRHSHRREADRLLVVAALDAQKLQVAAEQALQRQTTLLAIVAHELRNPLTPLLTTAAMITRVVPEELPRFEQVIKRQVRHLSRVIDDLVDLSRVNTGKLRLAREEVDFIDLVDAAVDACRPAMDTRLQRFVIHLPPPPLMIMGDPIRLTQVLGNLLDNASKYTPNEGEIRLTVSAVDGSVEIIVADNGIGITADALRNVFEPFVQESHAIGFNGDGLGLGLTVVHELIESHGGTVVARSAGTGHGSTFIVVLPLSDPPAR